MKKVTWSKNTLEFFYENAMLNDEEKYLMESRIKNTPISIQCEVLGYSRSTVNRMISNIKKKYDVVQHEYPDRLPPRIKSSKESWMDNN